MPNERASSAATATRSAGVDSRRELLGGDLRAAECLPLELVVSLHDQDAGRHGERQEEYREHGLQPALVDAPQERALHELTTNR